MIKTDLTLYYNGDNKYTLSIFFADSTMVTIKIDKTEADKLQKQGVELIEIPF